MALLTCAFGPPAATAVHRQASKMSSKSSAFAISFGFSQKVAAAAAASTASHAVRSRRSAVRTVAFRESAEVHDWRVKEMVAMAHTYFTEFLTKGRAELAEQLFDASAVHKDMVWDPVHPTVGIPAIKHYLEDLKATFPDFWVEVTQIATQDTNALWVQYEGCATGLGQYHGHKASGHTSNFTGINVIKFNADRTKIIEVQVYRSAFSEDRDELVEKVSDGGFRELRLKRLV